MAVTKVLSPVAEERERFTNPVWSLYFNFEIDSSRFAALH